MSGPAQPTLVNIVVHVSPKFGPPHFYSRIVELLSLSSSSTFNGLA